MTKKDPLTRARQARRRLAKTIAGAKFTDDLRSAHADGKHTDAKRGVDPTGYWTEVGCPSCCQDVI